MIIDCMHKQWHMMVKRLIMDTQALVGAYWMTTIHQGSSWPYLTNYHCWLSTLLIPMNPHENPMKPYEAL